MYVRHIQRRKNGKEHSYWSLVESRRLADGRVSQRHVLYLGEINDAQERAWARAVEVFPDEAGPPQTMALFPEERLPAHAAGGAPPAAPRGRRLAGVVSVASVAVGSVLGEAVEAQPQGHPLGSGPGRLDGLPAARARH